MDQKKHSKSLSIRVLFLLSMTLITISSFGVVPMSPYPTYQSPSTFWQGAQYEIPSSAADFNAQIDNDFYDMRYNYNINCLNLYGLENLTTAKLDKIFDKLKELGMQCVVRIEWYDKSWFNFEIDDANRMVNDKYLPLINYVCAHLRRTEVAYFALNVPVDDQEVVNLHFGGSRTGEWITRQPAFARQLVSRVKDACTLVGWNDPKTYVSIFYGWDVTYPVPVYDNLGATGVFLNNYTYPQNYDKNNAKDENNPDSVIINTAVLRKGMSKLYSQYGNMNKIIEYGFHTAEFNNGVLPDQIAGLVRTKAAKQKGLRATTAYYTTSSEWAGKGVKGTQYFGWNLLKEEGNPLTLMDWCLKYPVTGISEAEVNSLSGGSSVLSDTRASASKAVQGFTVTNAAVTVYHATRATSLTIRYACSGTGYLSLYVNGTFNQRITFPSTGSYSGGTYSTKTVTVNIPRNASVKLKRDANDNRVTVDYFNLGTLKSAEVIDDNNAFAENTPSDAGISAFPNPFSQELEIRLTENAEFNRLKVFDQLGQLIEDKNVKGLSELKLGSQYKKGSYVLQLISDREIESKLVIKK